jgi:hypothetical protein
MKLNRLALAAMILAATVATGRADPSTEDRAGAQDAISGQISAFARDDGAGAYAYAADPIRALFPSPEQFMEMVRRAYAPVYRPRSVVFGPARDGAAGGLVQETLITDAGGVDWIARYTLSRDADGRWRIIGCRLERNERDAA